MMRFSAIPGDVVVLIAEECTMYRDKAALAATSRRNYAIINPMLYRHNVRYGGQHCFHWGVRRGLIKTVLNALSVGADPNAFTMREEGIEYPTEGERIPDAGLTLPGMIEADVSVASCNRQYLTALPIAAREGFDDMVNCLLDNGAHIDLWAKGDCECRLASRWDSWTRPRTTALHSALCGEQESTAALLMARGANIRRLWWYQDAGEHATWDDLYAADAVGGAPSVFIDAGVTALHIVASAIDECQTLFVEARGSTDINAADVDGNTPLHWASQCPEGEHIIKALLAEGGNLEMENGDGYTPLQYACVLGNYRAALDLIDQGAKLSVYHDGLNVLHLAVADTSAYSTANWQACQSPGDEIHQALLRVLIEKGPDLEEETNLDDETDPLDGLTPANLAAHNHMPPGVFSTLIEAGIDLNDRGDDGSGCTPLQAMLLGRGMLQSADRGIAMNHFEIGQEGIKSMQGLIRLGARLDIPDEEDLTIFQWVAHEYRNMGFRTAYVFKLLRSMLEVADQTVLPFEHIDCVTLRAHEEGDQVLSGYLRFIWGGDLDLGGDEEQERNAAFAFDLDAVMALADDNFHGHH